MQMEALKSFFVKLGKRIRANFGWKTALFVAIAIALVLVDIITKTYEERDHWNFTVIPGLIVVKSGVRNPGAGFSWLADASWGQAFLVALTFVMLAAMVIGVLLIPERFTLLKLCLCVVAAGAVGNLIDRLAYGEVRDFIWMAVVNAYCNFADIFIVVGGIVAVIDLLFLNEWAVFPLTKRAREAQKKRSDEKSAGNSAQLPEGDEAELPAPEEPDQPAPDQSERPPEDGGGNGDE